MVVIVDDVDGSACLGTVRFLRVKVTAVNVVAGSLNAEGYGSSAMSWTLVKLRQLVLNKSPLLLNSLLVPVPLPWHRKRGFI